MSKMYAKATCIKMREPLLAINEDFNECMRCLIGTYESSLEILNHAEKVIEEELERSRNSRKKCKLPSKTYVNTHSNSNADCSISTRTRAAVKAKESKLTPTNATHIANETRTIHGRRRTSDKSDELSSKQKASVKPSKLSGGFQKSVNGITETPKCDKTFKIPRLLVDDVNHADDVHIPSTRKKTTSKSKIVDVVGDSVQPKSSSPRECLAVKEEPCSSTTLSSQTFLKSNHKLDVEQISPELRRETSKVAHGQDLSTTVEIIPGNSKDIIPEKTSIRANTRTKNNSKILSTGEKRYALRSSTNISKIKADPIAEREEKVNSSSPNETSSKNDNDMESLTNEKSPLSILGLGDNTMNNGIMEAKCSTPKTIEKKCTVWSSPNVQSTAISSSKCAESDNKEIVAPDSHAGDDETFKESPRRLRTKKKKSKGEDESLKGTRVARTKAKEKGDAAMKAVIAALARKSLSKAKLRLSVGKQRALNSQLTSEKVSGGICKLPKSSASKFTLLSKLRSPMVKDCLTHFGSQSKYGSLKKAKNLAATETGTQEHLNSASKGSKLNVAEIIKSECKTMDEEKEMKLRMLKEKEEEVLNKKIMSLKKRQKELKEKNEHKLRSAMKQRKKLETEKINNIVQLEKEKEAKRKMLLQERDNKIKESTLQKKILMGKKKAEVEERRKQEADARLAKLMEQELEQQRLMMERQKELELQEKRAQERLADQKTKKKYEMLLKQETMKQNVLSAKLEKENEFLKKIKVWNYKARNENDYGLEDENSEKSSEEEERPRRKRRLPVWAKKLFDGKCPVVSGITEHMMSEYMPCLQKTPDIAKIFNMTPKKRILRSSSAIWNTPSS